MDTPLLAAVTNTVFTVWQELRTLAALLVRLYPSASSLSISRFHSSNSATGFPPYSRNSRTDALYRLFVCSARSHSVMSPIAFACFSLFPFGSASCLTVQSKGKNQHGIHYQKRQSLFGCPLLIQVYPRPLL